LRRVRSGLGLGSEAHICHPNSLLHCCPNVWQPVSQWNSIITHGSTVLMAVKTLHFVCTDMWSSRTTGALHLMFSIHIDMAYKIESPLFAALSSGDYMLVVSIWSSSSRLRQMLLLRDPSSTSRRLQCMHGNQSTRHTVNSSHRKIM